MSTTYRALDHVFTVETPDLFHTRLQQALAPLADAGEVRDDEVDHVVIAAAGDDGWLISGAAATIKATEGAVIARVLEYINRCAAASLRDFVPLHAAAVRHGGDDVIALAGRSGAGKSTLGAAATLAGWGFLAEEVAAIEPSSLLVRPYHRPVGLRRGGAAALGVDYPIGDPIYEDVYPWPVHKDCCVESGHLKGVVLIRRDDDRARWETVRPPVALAELVEHVVVPDDERVVTVFHQLDSLVRRVPVARLTYSDAADGLRCLDEIVDTWR